jgi:hypothetical protein
MGLDFSGETGLIDHNWSNGEEQKRPGVRRVAINAEITT